MSDAVRRGILDKLNGQSVRLPDMTQLHPGWESTANPHQELVKSIIAEVLNNYSVTPTIVAKLTLGNLDHVLARWYPFASADRLTDLVHFVCWMYLLDDEIDQVSSPGRDSKTGFENLYNETMRFVSLTMGLSTDGEQLDELPTEENVPRSSVEAIESFRGIGFKLRDGYTWSQRKRFWRSIKLTMDGYKTEQQFRLSGTVPSYDGYYAYRYGSSCMYQVLVMAEYANEHQMPEEIMESKEMLEMWTSTVEIMWVENDIFSSKKEIHDGFIENLVVLSSGPACIAQHGMDHCVGRVQTAVSRFEQAAATLREKYSSYASNGPRTVAEELDLFVRNCKSQIVGLIIWSLSSGRYGLANLVPDEQGGRTYTIGEKEESLVTIRDPAPAVELVPGSSVTA